MSLRRFVKHLRRHALAALAIPFLAACWGDLVTDETVGPPRVPPAGSRFSTYFAMGTSLGAGIQSGGINDSTQRQTYVTVLARAMGHVLGETFEYPSFNIPGCPPPLTNVLTGARLTPPGFPPSVSSSCFVRAAASAAPVVHNVSIPGLRAAHILNVGDLRFAATDTLRLTTFITGGLNPIDVMVRARPTFVTLEAGANDVLLGATRGDTSLLTPVAEFQATFNSIASRIEATGADVAVMNVPNVTVIPHFVRGQVFFALKNVTPTPPFNTVRFTVDLTCVPSSAGGVGDSTAFPFATVATVAGTLAAGGLASVNCGLGVATTTPASPAPLAALDRGEFRAIVQNVAALNAFIQTRARELGWAYVDANAALLARVAAGQIPAFPNLAAPTSTIFGPLFSLDGIHPNAAGYRILAQGFVDAINTTFGTTVALP